MQSELELTIKSKSTFESYTEKQQNELEYNRSLVKEFELKNTNLENLYNTQLSFCESIKSKIQQVSQ